MATTKPNPAEFSSGGVTPAGGASSGGSSSVPTLNTTVKDLEKGKFLLPIAYAYPNAPSAYAAARGKVFDSDGYEWIVYFNAQGNILYREKTGRTKLQANVGDQIAKGSGGSGGGGGSAAPTLSQSDKEAFFDWMGRYPTSAEATQIASEGWNADVLRKYAVKNGGTGTAMQAAKNTLRQVAAGFYGGDPTAIPESMVNSLISSGDYADTSYLQNTYFPALRGVGATNPLATDFVQEWYNLVGEDKPLTNAALSKLNETVKAYGFSAVGLASFSEWAKRTESAYTGKYGAERRNLLTAAFQSILGRNPSAVELSNKSIYWGMESDQLQESLLQTPEGREIYKNKPAYEAPQDYIARLQSIDQVLRWYYGEHFVVNADKSLTYYGKATPVDGGIPDIPAYDASAANTLSAENKQAATTTATATAAWKSLTNAQFAADLKNYGIDVTNGKYFKDGAEVTVEQLDQILPDDLYYHDDAGFHYVQDEGAVDKYGKPALKYKKAVV